MESPQVWEYKGALFLFGRARVGTNLQIERSCLTMPDDKFASAKVRIFFE
jgi:hypothetical protein